MEEGARRNGAEPVSGVAACARHGGVTPRGTDGDATAGTDDQRAERGRRRS